MSKWWGVQWYSKNALDGESRHIMHERGMPIVCGTREEARHWIKQQYGYIRYREDLRREPHGWHMPRPVRIEVIARVIEENGKQSKDTAG